MAWLLWAVWALPVAVALITAVTRSPALTRVAGIAASVAVLACGGGLALAQASTSGPPVSGLLRADALSAFLLVVVGAVGLVATWGGLSDEADPHARTYGVLVALFLATMSLAVVADNLGVLWVAVEGTTVATAFLVGHRRTRTAVEAAWKYVLLGSVGIAIAFLGIVLLYAGTRAAGDPTLSWESLASGGTALDPDLLRAATGLAVLGFATKAGLAPMHSWLPDAHSQAPAPVSGLMSGVLLSVAFYAILRVQAIADAGLGPGFMRALLATGGLLSLTVVALLMLRQRDYKRLLAYSSIEHMGLLALGAAAGGPLALAAVLLHVLGHGLAKAGLFVLAGRILALQGSTRVADVRGLLRTHPAVAAPFLAGAVALMGLPPFSLFFSEVGILVAAWQSGLAVVVAVALFMLLVAFTGIARAAGSMALGHPTEGPAPSAAAGGPRAPILLALGVTAVAGFALTPHTGVLEQAAAALGGG